MCLCACAVYFIEYLCILYYMFMYLKCDDYETMTTTHQNLMIVRLSHSINHILLFRCIYLTTSVRILYCTPAPLDWTTETKTEFGISGEERHLLLLIYIGTWCTSCNARDKNFWVKISSLYRKLKEKYSSERTRFRKSNECLTTRFILVLYHNRGFISNIRQYFIDSLSFQNKNKSVVKWVLLCTLGAVWITIMYGVFNTY